MGHKALTADIVADARRDRCEVGVEDSRHVVSPVLLTASGATTARIAHAIRMSVWSLGSERSRPDRKARQKICAGPMIWLKNNVGVIGSNSPRAISGARQ